MKIDPQCPVCGFGPLGEPPYSEKGGGSYEICECCNFEFGYDDQSFTFDEWRARWIAGGMLWGGDGKDEPPTGWEPEAQLASLQLG